MLPTFSYEPCGSSHALIISHRRFRSEIWIHPARALCCQIHEWGPGWHELDLGKFTIDLSHPR